MGNTTYAETLASAQLITSGLRANLDKLAKRGMDESFVSGMEGTLKKVADLNAEQEALKARLKEKTAAVDSTLTELKGQISESKKVVKLALDSASWKQFGIT
jgi:cell shape-determining protein MreC